MSVVYTGGSFDWLHEGHLELLEACRRMAGDGGRVIVALNTDDFIVGYREKAPMFDYATREKMLLALRYVDEVIPNWGAEDSTLTIDWRNYCHKYSAWNVDRDKPDQWRGVLGHSSVNWIDIIAIGSDWADRDYYAQMGFTKEWLDSRELVLAYIDRRTGESSTRLKESYDG